VDEGLDSRVMGPCPYLLSFFSIHRLWVVVHDYNNNGGYYYELLTLKITASFPLHLEPWSDQDGVGVGQGRSVDPLMFPLRISPKAGKIRYGS
jgi:hypothetical protein